MAELRRHVRWSAMVCGLCTFLTTSVAASTVEAADPPASGKPTVIEATDRLTFSPATVTVHVGELVRWHNGSSLVHTITADPAKAVLAESVRLPKGASPFDSGALAPGATFQHRFLVPGRYRYFCVPHEAAGMRGTIVVLPSTATPRQP